MIESPRSVQIATFFKVLSTSRMHQYQQFAFYNALLAFSSPQVHTRFFVHDLKFQII